MGIDIFFRDSLINTERYTDPGARAPLSFYLMKKVKLSTAQRFLLTHERSEEIKAATQTTQSNHDLFQEALHLKNYRNGEVQVIERKIARARLLLTKLANEGIARAQLEAARMYRLGIGGERELEKSNHYRDLACAQWLDQGLVEDFLSPSPVATETPMAGAGAANVGQGHSIVGGLQLPIIPVLEGDDQFGRVSSSFAELGPMYRVGDLLWSGVSPQTRNFADAIQFCASLGGGSRLPDQFEYATLATSMGKGLPGGYNHELIPGMVGDVVGRWFWSSSAHHIISYYAHFFTGRTGNICNSDKGEALWVRCVSSY